MIDSARKRAGKLLSASLLAVCVLFVVLPLALMLLNSFRPMKDLTRNGPLSLPSQWTLDNYIKAWMEGDFVVYYKSSVIITVATVCLTLAVVLIASYAIVYMDLPMKKGIMTLFLLGLIGPFEQIMLPLFANLRSYGWINHYVSVIVPQVALNIPLGVMLVTTFMKKVPGEIIEAARIDGATELGVMWRVVTPMVKPILSTLLVFSAMGSWNNFMLPNIMLKSNSVRTVTVGLNAFKDSNTADFPLTAAATFIVAVPIILVYIIFQQKVQDGMTAGAIKG